jgi:hypothetical protein
VLGFWSCAACSEDPRGGTPSSAGASGAPPAAGAGGSTPMIGPILLGPGPAPGPSLGIDLGASCDETRGVKSGGAALLVRDPEVLARFSLERVLARLIETAGAETTPLVVLQQLFDTQNTAQDAVFPGNVHCDDVLNPAFGNSPAVDCPRAEGALASSAALLSEDDPDGFYPIALVNRFDRIAPNLTTCGNYDILFAKRSGATEPTNRVLLALQGFLPNAQGTLANCRPVAELWAGLESDENPQSRAALLDQFYFEGLPGFDPVVHAAHYGLGAGDCGSPVQCGQIQVGQGMQEPWQFRQFRPALSGASGAPELYFLPSTLSGTPRRELFDPASPDPLGPSFRAQLVGAVAGLSTSVVPRVQFWSSPIYEAGESAVSGAAAPSYLARVDESPLGQQLRDELQNMIALTSHTDCPGDDPLSADSLLQRVTALSCAGCHAPDATILPDRAIGCGQSWPRSLGVSHVNEQGELSEALSQVFLPHRAELLTMFLQACRPAALISALGIYPPTEPRP